MAATIPEDAKKLIDGKSFATVTTLNPDGGPQSTVLWITHEGDDILLSATDFRQKTKNLQRDPRINVVVPRENPQTGYLEVRGRAEIVEEGGRDLINRLYNKYIGEGDYPWDAPGDVRVVLRVTPEKVNWVLQG